ncbi:hypothetical protein HU200_067317 [Digitaria exilis]|uniref:Plantacyanin n=1 Tax=Digitaria exilis TaxID=1010633 RepID=A0A834ZWU8_9POAL|nr:hypothetical protein HU200_067317 [Digitaria exilis]CAB3449518.1 unnamed protein product [Digitaria exilis]
MACRSISSIILVLLLGVICTATVVYGGHQVWWLVGGDNRWSFGVDGWVKDKPIQAGNILVFSYDPEMHDVVEVDEAAYNTCTMPSNGGTRHTSGRDRIEVREGKSFFICSTPGHCTKGMKIAITA